TFHRAGKTLILVSHDVASICNICTEAIWLESGRIRAHGPPRVVVSDYQAAAHGTAAPDLKVAPAAGALDDAPPPSEPVPDRWGSGEVEILDVEFLDGDGQPRSAFRMGQPLVIALRYRAKERIEAPVFGIGLTSVDGVHIAGPNTRVDGARIDSIYGDGRVFYATDELPLLPGVYAVSASVYDETCTHAYDFHDRRYALRVLADESGVRYGLVRIP